MSSTKFVFFFRADQKNKMAALASGRLRPNWLFFWKCWTEFNETDKKQDLHVLYQVCAFRADQNTRMAALADR